MFFKKRKNFLASNSLSFTKNRNPFWVLAILVSQFTILLILLFSNIWVITTDRQVLIEIFPIDSEYTFNQNVLSLKFKISTFQGSLQTFQEDPKLDDNVWVVLENKTQNPLLDWTIKNIYPQSLFDNSKIEKDNVSLLAKIKSIEKLQGKEFFYNLTLDYGIEEFYLSQDADRNLDLRDKKLQARVLISENGESQINEILIDSKPWPKI